MTNTIILCNREKLSAFLQSIVHERKRANNGVKEKNSWERYLSCTPLPDPTKANEMNDYFNAMEKWGCKDLQTALQKYEVALHSTITFAALKYWLETICKSNG